jgi:hypothetical protein
MSVWLYVVFLNQYTPFPLHADNQVFTVIVVESALCQLEHSDTSRGGHYALNHFFDIRLQIQMVVYCVCMCTLVCTQGDSKSSQSYEGSAA